MKKMVILGLTVFLLVSLVGCGSKTADSKPLSTEKLVIGVSAGPHEQIMEKVKELAAADGLKIELKVFTEYVMPNIALSEGELDVNIFQHKPYLDKFKEDRGLDLIEVGYTVNFPMGIYSDKIKDVSELKEGDKVGLPNDPTNGARALILFESAGLIKLKEGVGVAATVNDITENPRGLDFIELEASQIPRQLNELAAAAINSNFAIEHGFVPTTDSIYIEPNDSPWVNIVAVRTENKDDEVIKTLLQYYQSDEVKEFIEVQFEGSVVPAW
ncbi:MetQ/NlpA family ABC transporter substrate-binding protein [Alkaliphilus crotonatoxidans]